jgi:hypothetical protein
VSDRDGGIVVAGDPSAILWTCAEPSPETRKSAVGRPRRLTDQQVVWVLAEYARYQAWRELRPTLKSQRQLARELGVSQATISLAVRSGGQYKQLSPEQRLASRSTRRRSASRKRHST